MGLLLISLVWESLAHNFCYNFNVVACEWRKKCVIIAFILKKKWQRDDVGREKEKKGDFVIEKIREREKR